MAAPNLDELLGKLRRLSSGEIAKVEALVDQLGPPERGNFDAFCGIMSPEDVKLMAEAEADCERIDPSGW